MSPLTQGLKYCSACDNNNNNVCNLLHSELPSRSHGSPRVGSGDWLFALPITSCVLRLDDEAVRVAVTLRLGLPVCIPHQCHCRSLVDAHEVHSFICKKAPGRTVRHHALNDLIARSFVSADIPVEYPVPTANALMGGLWFLGREDWRKTPDMGRHCCLPVSDVVFRRSSQQRGVSGGYCS